MLERMTRNANAARVAAARHQCFESSPGTTSQMWKSGALYDSAKTFSRETMIKQFLEEINICLADYVK